MKEESVVGGEATFMAVTFFSFHQVVEIEMQATDLHPPEFGLCLRHRYMQPNEEQYKDHCNIYADMENTIQYNVLRRYLRLWVLTIKCYWFPSERIDAIE